MNEYQTFGEYKTSDKRKGVTALTFLFIGVGVGAVMALLFAPRTGKQMRKTIRRKYEDAMDTMDDLRDQAGEYVERGRDWARDAADRSRDMARGAKKKVEPMARRFARD